MGRSHSPSCVREFSRDTRWDLTRFFIHPKGGATLPNSLLTSAPVPHDFCLYCSHNPTAWIFQGSKGAFITAFLGLSKLWVQWKARHFHKATLSWYLGITSLPQANSVRATMKKPPFPSYLVYCYIFLTKQAWCGFSASGIKMSWAFSDIFPAQASLSPSSLRF